MVNLDQIKITAREQQVLNLLVQGFSNKEIGGELNISVRTVKQHLRILFLRVGIREGAKRVKLARYAYEDESVGTTPCQVLDSRESEISILVWEGLTNREIGKIVGTSEQMVKYHLRSAFDKLGLWNRLELSIYVASHGGKYLQSIQRELVQPIDLGRTVVPTPSQGKETRRFRPLLKSKRAA
jgi:DNA-binding NarL/FixJ family response regulator